MSSGGGAVTGLVLGILMALAIGGVEGSTADLESAATETPSDAPPPAPTAVAGGIDSTELATRAALDDLLSTVLVGDEVVLARWSAAAPAMRHAPPRAGRAARVRRS